MKLLKLRWLSVLVFVMVSVETLPAQTTPPADLDGYVANVLKTFEVPGLSVAVVKDGKTVLAKGYGVRKLGSPTAVDENTLFGDRFQHQSVTAISFSPSTIHQKPSAISSTGNTIRSKRIGATARSRMPFSPSR